MNAGGLLKNGRDSFDSAKAFARDAGEDAKARRAARDLVTHGRDVYTDLSRTGARDGLTRLARDRSLQSEVSALVRSAANAVEQGTTVRRRRRRRRIMTWVGLSAFGAFVAGRLVNPAARPELTDTTDGASHGAPAYAPLEDQPHGQANSPR